LPASPGIFPEYARLDQAVHLLLSASVPAARQSRQFLQRKAVVRMKQCGSRHSLQARGEEKVGKTQLVNP